MRLASLPPSLAVFAVTLLGLTACLGSDPTLVPDPEPTTTPVFASDEEALAAAEEAYAAYIAVSDQILIDGGTNPERLLEVATQEVYDSELEGFERRSQEGLRSVGHTIIASTKLQTHESAGELVLVVLYVCIDVSGVDVVDAAGASVVSPGRPTKLPFEATFDVDDQSAATLILSGHEFWEGANFCA